MKITSKLKITSYIIKDNVLKGIDLIGTHIGTPPMSTENVRAEIKVIISLIDEQIILYREAERRIPLAIFDRIEKELIERQSTFEQMTAKELTLAVDAILTEAFKDVR